MAKKSIDINQKETIKFTKKLEAMHRSKLPNAIRNTLNEVAFKTKKLIPEEAKKLFDIRSPSFFRSFSRVETAKGFDIDTMVAKAGMQDSKFGGKSEQAGRNQTQQQLSGTIGGRTFIPLDTARTSNSNKKNVRRADRLSRLNIVIDSKESTGATAKKRFVQSAIQAVEKFGGQGVVIKHRRDDGKEFLYRVQRGGSDIQTRDFAIKVTPLYSVVRGRKVAVEGNPFTLFAARRATKNIDQVYAKHAKKQINKLRRK